MRLLLPHPEAEVTIATSRRFAGEYVYMIHPNLRGITPLKFTPMDNATLVEECDVVFCATPHGVSQNFVP